MKNKSAYFIRREGFFGIASIVCMIIAIVLRIVGEIMCGIKFNENVLTLVNYLIMPSACCLLFILSVACFGKKGLWTSFIAAAIGTAFFIERLFTAEHFGGIQLSEGVISIFILVYVLFACLYSATVTGGINKWITISFMILGIAYHVAVFDVPVLIAKEFSTETLILELGIIFIFLGILFALFGMKRRYIARPSQGSQVPPPVPGNELSGGSLPAHTLPQDKPKDEPEIVPENKPEDNHEEKPSEIPEDKPEPMPEAREEKNGEEKSSEEKLTEILEDNKPFKLTLEPDTREISFDALEPENDPSPAAPEPPRTDAQLPVSFGEKLKGIFSRKLPETEPAAPFLEKKPDINNVIEAIEDNIPEEKDDF